MKYEQAILKPKKKTEKRKKEKNNRNQKDLLVCSCIDALQQQKKLRGVCFPIII